MRGSLQGHKRTVGYGLLFGIFFTLIVLFPQYGGAEVPLSKGQTVYVPIYSHIYSGNKEMRLDLAATLSIRNTDPHHTISIITVDYYDSSGNLISKYIEQPVTLNAMASTRYVVKESDRSGGSGANFIVRWTADTSVSPPLIEAVMIGARGGQGISFTSRGQVISEDQK